MTSVIYFYVCGTLPFALQLFSNATASLAVMSHPFRPWKHSKVICRCRRMINRNSKMHPFCSFSAPRPCNNPPVFYIYRGKKKSHFPIVCVFFSRKNEPVPPVRLAKGYLGSLKWVLCPLSEHIRFQGGPLLKRFLS